MPKPKSSPSTPGLNGHAPAPPDLGERILTALADEGWLDIERDLEPTAWEEALATVRGVLKESG
jgi:hypothetical protein